MFTHRKQLPLKPATQLAVDYSHWLAPYLSCCYMQNELGPTAKMVDLTLHANHGAPTGTTMQVGPYGRERVFASGNLVAVPYGPQLDSITMWPGAHIRATIILARVKSTGGATSSQVICCRGYDGVFNIPYFLGIGGINAAGGVGHYTGGFVNTGVTTDIRADNTYHVVCGVLVDTPGLGAYSGFYYLDGVRDTYALLGSFPNPGTVALNVGADYNNTSSFIGVIESLQIFVGVPIPDISSSSPSPANHAMYLDGLIADLSRNPYQLLTAAKPKSAFVLSTNLTLAISGVSSTSALGSLGVKNTLAISGNQSASSIGSIAQQRTLPVIGNTANGITGTLSYSLTKAISGNSANGSIGSVSYGLSKALSGLQSNSSIGSVSYGVAKALTGNASVTGLGALSYGLRLSTAGVQATGYAGTVSAPTGNITLAITGVHAVLSAGSISPSVAVNITGTDAVGGVGTLSHEMSLKLSGVQSSGGVGAVFAPFGIFSAKTQDAEATNCLSNDHELTNGSVQDDKITTITIKEEP